MSLEGSGQLLAALAMVTQLGFIMVACILTGFAAGRYLDGLIGTEPVFTIVLLLAGIGGGMTAAYKVIMGAVGQKRQDTDDLKQ